MKNKFLLLVAAVGLMSCGGGGGGTSSASSETINGIVVPPAPPAASATATAAGIDANNNGVRDDVERVVAQTAGTTPAVHAAGISAATSIQAVIATGTASSMQTYLSETVCAASNLKPVITRVELETSNNRERQKKLIDAYLALMTVKANATDGGIVISACN